MTYITIGTMYIPTGVMLKDNDGNEYPEMVATDGYYVNVLDVPDMTLIQPYVITVNTPSYTFAGRDDMICLKFKDRAEWLSLGLEVEDEGLL